MTYPTLTPLKAIARSAETGNTEFTHEGITYIWIDEDILLNAVPKGWDEDTAFCITGEPGSEVTTKSRWVQP